MVEHPTLLLQDLPHHAPDHLLYAVGQHLLPECLQELLLDAFDGGLAQPRGGLEAGDLFGSGEKRPDALAEVRRIE